MKVKRSRHIQLIIIVNIELKFVDFISVQFKLMKLQIWHGGDQADLISVNVLMPWKYTMSLLSYIPDLTSLSCHYGLEYVSVKYAGRLIKADPTPSSVVISAPT